MNMFITGLITLLLMSSLVLLLMFRKLRPPSSRWPVVDALVERAEVTCASPRTRPEFSTVPCWICKLQYAYRVKGREYKGECKCVLPSEQLAYKLAEMKKGNSIRVHYNSGAPQFSFIDREEEDALTRSANLLRLGMTAKSAE
jgi:Protein of unknown function (DUF3592)